jgi:hypothetical protein
VVCYEIDFKVGESDRCNLFLGMYLPVSVIWEGIAHRASDSDRAALRANGFIFAPEGGFFYDFIVHVGEPSCKVCSA